MRFTTNGILTRKNVVLFSVAKNSNTYVYIINIIINLRILKKARSTESKAQ
jgi:hypothetical protein